jgi:hypothetical protein
MHQGGGIRPWLRHHDKIFASRISNRRKHRSQAKNGSEKQNPFIEAFPSVCFQFPFAPTVVAARAGRRRMTIGFLLRSKLAKKR